MTYGQSIYLKSQVIKIEFFKLGSSYQLMIEYIFIFFIYLHVAS